jgi:alcohol dehydrogenase YqhD (iron-dependent ADH family)
MMTHTIERYFTPHAPTDLTDRIAESILKSIIIAGKTAIDNPTDYEARATLMWASSLAHNGLTGCGRENYLAVHQLEHAVSGIYDEVAHGAGLAVLYPAFIKFIYKKNQSRFAQFFSRVFDASGETDEAIVLDGIEKMQEFFAYIGMPNKLSDFNIGKDQIERLALHCSQNKTVSVKSYIPLGYEELKEIFALAF